MYEALFEALFTTLFQAAFEALSQPAFGRLPHANAVIMLNGHESHGDAPPLCIIVGPLHRIVDALNELVISSGIGMDGV